MNYTINDSTNPTKAVNTAIIGDISVDQIKETRGKISQVLFKGSVIWDVSNILNLGKRINPADMIEGLGEVRRIQPSKELEAANDERFDLAA
ncbi:MAG: hypothetical protein PHE25_03970 [Candidatus Gracilibacteria bacterium]|nr:hypothetical protein [Candidatus Gracilibacteria bacterium]